MPVVHSNRRGKGDGSQLGLISKKTAGKVVIIICSQAIRSMNTKTDINGVIDFMSHVKIRQHSWIGNITTVPVITTINWLTNCARGSNTGGFSLSINIQNRRTKRNIGTRQLAHTGRVEQHCGSVFGVGGSAGVGDAHQIGRASCRERVWMWGGAVALKDKAG